MNLRMTFRTWRRYKNSHAQRVKEYQEKGQMNYESSIEDSPIGPIQNLDSAKAENLPIRMNQELNNNLDRRPSTEAHLKSTGSNEMHKEGTATERPTIGNQQNKESEMPNMQEGGVEEVAKNDK